MSDKIIIEHLKRTERETEAARINLIKQALIEHEVEGKLHIDHLELYCRNTDNISVMEALNLLGFDVGLLVKEIEEKLGGK